MEALNTAVRPVIAYYCEVAHLYLKAVIHVVWCAWADAENRSAAAEDTINLLVLGVQTWRAHEEVVTSGVEAIGKLAHENPAAVAAVHAGNAVSTLITLGNQP